jgi:hypothetical protein
MLTPGHRRKRRQVEAYVDGELHSARTIARVEQHLHVCWGCSGDADALRLIKSSFRSLADRRPTDLGLVRLQGWFDVTSR